MRLECSASEELELLLQVRLLPVRKTRELVLGHFEGLLKLIVDDINLELGDVHALVILLELPHLNHLLVRVRVRLRPQRGIRSGLLAVALLLARRRLLLNHCLLLLFFHQGRGRRRLFFLLGERAALELVEGLRLVGGGLGTGLDAARDPAELTDHVLHGGRALVLRWCLVGLAVVALRSVVLGVLVGLVVLRVVRRQLLLLHLGDELGNRLAAEAREADRVDGDASQQRVGASGLGAVLLQARLLGLAERSLNVLVAEVLVLAELGRLGDVVLLHPNGVERVADGLLEAGHGAGVEHARLGGAALGNVLDQEQVVALAEEHKDARLDIVDLAGELVELLLPRTIGRVGAEEALAFDLQLADINTHTAIVLVRLLDEVDGAVGGFDVGGDVIGEVLHAGQGSADGHERPAAGLTAPVHGDGLEVC
mmetsp:Transcript_2100/g.6526  ORF Transcript_2100/g.6526 Transcript_2100/m.6526 type:complete len:425 (-) Transcript_2100:21-1295(-)